MFEAGKTYRTRGGGMATVLRVDKDGTINARHEDGERRWHFSDDGHFSSRSEEHTRDLLPGAIEDTPTDPVETLRDRFAMAALTGVMTGAEGYAQATVAERAELNRQVAALIYELADAMLAEREKPHV